MGSFRLWREGLSAAWSRPVLLVPLGAAEFIAAGLSLMVSLWVKAHFTGLRGTDDAARALVQLFRVLGTPSFWSLMLAGYGLAAAGAWLVRNTVHSGVVSVLGERLRGIEPAPHDAFERGVLGGVAEFLSARVPGALLVAIASASSLGMLVAGAVMMVEAPGVISALALACGVTGLFVVPMLEAATLLGACRAVLQREPPLVALGEGFHLAMSHPGGLLFPWYLLAIAAGVVDVASVLGTSLVDGLAQTPSLELIGWGPRLGLVAMAALMRAIVAVMRLGLVSSLALEDELPGPPPGKAPAQELPPTEGENASGAPGDEPIYEAVAVRPVASHESDS